MHVVPKYKGGFAFGGIFEMNPQKTLLSDVEYAEIIEKIKASL
jgi:diadenosine tetraphosphate (Ap4A) HIT family hydrolase